MESASAGLRREARAETMTDERLDSLERWREDMEKRFADAFPGGDHVGHCRYHRLMIEDIEARRKLRQAVMEKSVAGLVWAGLVFLGLAAWTYFKNLVHG